VHRLANLLWRLRRAISERMPNTMPSTLSLLPDFEIRVRCVKMASYSLGCDAFDHLGQRRALPRLRFDEATDSVGDLLPSSVPNADLLRIDDPLADMSAAQLS